MRKFEELLSDFKAEITRDIAHYESKGKIERVENLEKIQDRTKNVKSPSQYYI